jgi:molybdopterin-guanine dinucleotide biosynthesis protein A
MNIKSGHDYNIAGVVLAGGKSSRMGQNKALLDFHGIPLVEYMMGILDDCGIRDVFISGNLDGYPCISDTSPFSGPASAIADCLNQLYRDGYGGVLFVPVDMPFITKGLLTRLFESGKTSCFEDRPLPAYVSMDKKIAGNMKSVRDLLKEMGVNYVSPHIHNKQAFININTPEDWKEWKGAV